MLKQSIITAAAIIAVVHNAAALSPAIDRLEKQSQSLEKRVRSQTKKYCNYNIDLSRRGKSRHPADQNAMLSVRHRRQADRNLPTRISCPDISNRNHRDWFDLIDKQKQLHSKIEEFLQGNLTLDEKARQKLRALQLRVGRRLTCDFVRLIHDDSFETMQIARRVLQQATIDAPTGKDKFSPQQIGVMLFSRIYEETVHPGPCSPPQCLPNEMGARVDTSLWNSKQICSSKGRRN